MLEGRSKQAFKAWLAQRPQAWRDSLEVVAMDGFTGFKTATTPLAGEHSGAPDLRVLQALPNLLCQKALLCLPRRSGTVHRQILPRIQAKSATESATDAGRRQLRVQDVPDDRRTHPPVPMNATRVCTIA